MRKTLKSIKFSPKPIHIELLKYFQIVSNFEDLIYDPRKNSLDLVNCTVDLERLYRLDEVLFLELSFWVFWGRPLCLEGDATIFESVSSGATSRSSFFLAALKNRTSKARFVKVGFVLFTRTLEKLFPPKGRSPSPPKGSQVRNLHFLYNESDFEESFGSFYRLFEQTFRGPYEDIKERLKFYLPFVQRCQGIIHNLPSLDLGCGRGEWLELLSENKIPNMGLDLNKEVVLQTRMKKSLNMEVGDLFSFLQNVPSNSFSVITGFHIIEHISFYDQIWLLKLCFKALAPGGLLLLETPNTENLRVATSSFYLDPTHIRPVPAGLLIFLFQYSGFERVEFHRLNPMSGYNQDTATQIVSLMDGPMDYSVLGYKPLKA